MESLIQDDFESIKLARKHRTDRYVYEKFSEESAPDLAKQSRRVHAEGYKSMGFVKDEALSEDGTMKADIDKARGASVEYFAAVDTSVEDEAIVATLRKVGIPKNGTIDDLPAYTLCANTLYDGEEEFLRTIDNPDDRIKEIGALARIEGSNPLATLELLRNVHQESLGKNEVWFFSIVSSTYETLEDNFGAKAIRKIGEGVKLDDDRVGDNIRLVPAVVDVDNLIDNMLEVMENEENRGHRARIFRTVMFFTDGLDASEMSDDVKDLRQAYNERANHRAS